MLEDYMKRSLPDIERAIEEALPSESDYPSTIHRAMRYSALGGGKRLRALLVLASCEMLNGNRSAALKAGAALEMLHAYSLVHDDLPCMDDDDLRRGKPSNHIVFGEGVAVLAGDALLTEAFACLASLVKVQVSPSIVVEILREVSSAAGSRGLIGGQVVDLESEGRMIDEETLRYIHSHKTGALFRACLRTGARLGRANAAQLSAVTEFAEEFGLAFQIVDDILDIVGTTAQLGKRAGSDERQEKVTYPFLFGLERSREMAAECVQRAHRALSMFGERADILAGLASYVLARKS